MTTTASGKTCCKICKEKDSNYTCPRCNIPYCSLDCYKSLEHQTCSTSLAQDTFASNLKSETASEDVKRQMLEVLKRFQTFDFDSDASPLEGVETSSLGFLGELDAEDVDKMSTEELMALIGPDALEKAERMITKNPEFIKQVAGWSPWWIPPPPVQVEDDTKPAKTIFAPISKVPERLEELPPLSKLLAKDGARPPEMLWNNLVELLYFYIHFYRLYLGELVEDEMFISFTNDFLSLSKVLSTQRFTHFSIIHALRSSEASIAIESDLYLSDETKGLLIDDLIILLKDHQKVISALADLQRVFERSLRKRKENFSVAKKIYFYNVWFADEVRRDLNLVKTVLASMVALVLGYKEKLLGKDVVDRDELKNLVLPIEIINNKQDNTHHFDEDDE